MPKLGSVDLRHPAFLLYTHVYEPKRFQTRLELFYAPVATGIDLPHQDGVDYYSVISLAC